jgi:hypothetical protein
VESQTATVPGKHPRTYNGVKGASSNLEQIATWADDAFPAANWGVATGNASGVVVVHLDLKDGDGINQWAVPSGESSHPAGDVHNSLGRRWSSYLPSNVGSAPQEPGEPPAKCRRSRRRRLCGVAGFESRQW